MQFAHPRNLHEAISLATEYECFEMSSSRRNTKPVNGRVCIVEDKQEDKVLKDILSNLKKNNYQIDKLADELKTIKSSKQSDYQNKKTSNKGHNLKDVDIGVMKKVTILDIVQRIQPPVENPVVVQPQTKS